MRTRSNPWRNAAQSNILTRILSASLGSSYRRKPSISNGRRPAGTDRPRSRDQNQDRAWSMAPPIDALPDFQTSDNSPVERTYFRLQRGGAVAFHKHHLHDDGRIGS
jgi:hypothetical protein